MINKILFFSEKGQILLKRNYGITLSDDAIMKLVCTNKRCNFIQGPDMIIFNKYDDFYMSFTTHGENEAYIFEFITFLKKQLEKRIDSLSEPVFSCHFKTFHEIVDNFVLQGKIVNTDQKIKLNQ